eukprot:IDg12747t1
MGNSDWRRTTEREAPCFRSFLLPQPYLYSRTPPHQRITIKHISCGESSAAHASWRPVVAAVKMGVRDRIVMRGLRFYGRHGVLRAERELGQRFEVDVTISADLREPGRSDRIKDTLDYSRVFGIVKDAVEGTPRNLIECVAEDIATSVLHEMPKARDITVCVAKPHVALPGVFDSVGVEIFRERE